jgi:hypothetical protein
MTARTYGRSNTLTEIDNAFCVTWGWWCGAEWKAWSRGEEPAGESAKWWTGMQCSLFS